MKTFPYSSNWFNSQLLSVVRQGDRVVCGEAQLQREGDFFVMTGPTGRHSICVASTDAARLQAHWRGFMVTNRFAAR